MIRKILGLTLIFAVLAGCTSAPAAPTLDLRPTLDAVKTEAIKTMDAELTLIAPSVTPSKTLTPTASRTPPPTSTPTRTRTPNVWTFTPTLPAGGCQVVGQGPDLYSSFLPEAGFDARWDVKNRSGETWYKDQVRVRYVSGAVLQTKTDEAELEGDVGAGSTVSVVVDMQAPSLPGTYVANWAVYRDQKIQCGLTVIIKVQP